MTKAERAAIILAQLEKLYPNPPIPLQHTDAYTLLVAVTLSAQCTDIRVNQVTEELFKIAKSPKQMARLTYSEIEKIIHPCGLGKQKAKALKETAIILIEKFSGNVPSNFEDLISLPGVGRKTAQVVQAQWFNIPSFPIDTHIHRLAKRWKLTSGKNVLETEKSLKKIFAEKLWNKLHLQIIFFGREHCTSRGCDGARCLICSQINSKRY